MAGTSEHQRSTRGGNGADTPLDSERGGVEDGRTADVPRWFDRTPSGVRDGVDEEEAETLAARPRQEQVVTQDEKSVRRFTWTQFIGHVNDKISFNRNGDMVFQIVVPYQFKHLAEPLTDAFGIPLSFDVEVWKPFAESIERDSGE
jgi:hypothetical protein